MRRSLSFSLLLLGGLAAALPAEAPGQARRPVSLDTVLARAKVRDSTRFGAPSAGNPSAGNPSGSAGAAPTWSAPKQNDGRRGKKGASVLAGFVKDSLGRAIPYAEVALDEYDAATVTDDSGFFRLERVPSGVMRFTAYRLDYRPVTFEIDMPAALTVHVDIRLRGGVTAVREVSDADSAAPSARLTASGFFQRASLRNGYFFSPTDVEMRNGYTHVAYLLRQVPGFSVEESTDGNAVRLKGRGCLRYYVDDKELPQLPDSLSPLQVLAMEVYPAFVTTPTRFRGYDRRECGVVAVWTKLPKPYGKK